MRNAKQLNDLDFLLQLHFVFVRSLSEYIPVALDSYFEVHVNRLESAQQKSLKFIYFRIYGTYSVVGYFNELLLEEFGIKTKF